jgi:hypothetical protein
MRAKFQWTNAQGLKPHSLLRLYGTTKEAAEKVGRRMEMRPSAAKAHTYFQSFMYGLKSVPFKEQSFPQPVKSCPDTKQKRPA